MLHGLQARSWYFAAALNLMLINQAKRGFGSRPKKVSIVRANCASMSEAGPGNAETLHDAVVKRAAVTMFKKYKVVMNIAGNKVASVGDLYPDLLAYEVFSVKPFLASDVPVLVGIVHTADVISQKLLDEWAQLEHLDVDKIVLLLPIKMRDRADVLQHDLGPKFELHFFDNELNIS